MIYLDIVGRCGNQMFQYAFAKKISILNNDEEIIIDFFHVYREAENRQDATFKNELNLFHARESFTEIKDGENKIYKYGSKSQILIFKIYTKIKRFLEKFINDKRLANKLFYKIMSHYGIYWFYAPEKLKKCKQKNKFIWGYFENPKYFDDIKEQLYQDFTPVYPIQNENADIYGSIMKNNSVCLSIRKWEDNEPINNNYLVCSRTYYDNAINKIERLVPNPQYVIFSNNIEWVKKEFVFPENTIYESGEAPIYEKIRMMYSCKHFILSNSTFSWWAQYLGRNDGKIIVAPECWRKSDKKHNPLICDSFQKVSIQ